MIFEPHPHHRGRAVWPLPALNGRAPAIIPPAVATPRGIDLAYARVTPSELVHTYPPGSRNGTTTYFMPSGMPALAAADGVIRYAGRIMHGFTILVEHGDGWATYYGNLAHMFATRVNGETLGPPQRVTAGDVLGHVGSMQPGGFACLHFQLWRADGHGGFADVDPSPHMKSWLQLPWNDEHLTPAIA
jgi:murein DD-endopeptidase MepM/ murein hydrolase activator NlpD